MKELEKLILELGELAHRSHFWVDEDNWYSCPKAPDGCADDTVDPDCNCGADEHNTKVDEILKQIRLQIIVEKWKPVLNSNNSNTKAMLLEAHETYIPQNN